MGSTWTIRYMLVNLRLPIHCKLEDVIVQKVVVFATPSIKSFDERNGTDQLFFM